MKSGYTALIALALVGAVSAPAGAAQGDGQVESLAVAQDAPSATASPVPAPAGSGTPAPQPSGTATSDPATDAERAAKKAERKAAKKAERKAAKKAAKKAKKKAKKERLTKVRVSASVSPGQRARYGVGQLVTVDFSRSIKRKRAVERAIRVTSKKKLPPGAWGWIDSNTAVYRPKRFWPGKAKIKFRMDLRGVVLGAEGDTRYVGARNSKYVLRTARSFVLRIKNGTKRLYVEKNGKIVKAFPVSLGKTAGGYRTRSGIKVLTGDKNAALRMRGTDRLTGETWDVISPYSIRLTPTGEYIHGAPWAYSRLGLWNGSHGCTNMYVADARWLYKRVRAGDPTVTRGTGRPMETWNGTPGAYWNYSWKAWKAKSASR